MKKTFVSLLKSIAILLIQADIRQWSGTSHSNKTWPKSGTYLLSHLFCKFPPWGIKISIDMIIKYPQPPAAFLFISKGSYTDSNRITRLWFILFIWMTFTIFSSKRDKCEQNLYVFLLHFKNAEELVILSDQLVKKRKKIRKSIQNYMISLVH